MRIRITIWLLIGSMVGFAQRRTDSDFSETIENLFQVQDENIDYEGLYESLLIFYTNPINLNRTTPDELENLYLLSPAQINAFFIHIQRTGPLISLYELQSIDGFDMATIRKLLPFVTVEEKLDSRPLWQRIREEQNHYLLMRQSGTVEKQAGFQAEEAGYLGSPGISYLRYRIQKYNDFSFGFTAEKDAGEKYWDSNTKSTDFFSAHASLENVGVFRKIIVGDYQIQYGQGLVFGAGFSAGKGAETVNSIKRSSLGIKPYASSLESGFFRGVATSIQKKHLRLTVFFSSLRQDANLIRDSTYSNFDEFANSIQATGYHRTASEVAARNRIAEHSYGGAVEYSVKNLIKIGATALHTDYSRPIQKKPNNYNQFEFQGSQNTIGSVFATGSWQNLIIFGEAAQSSSGGIGLVGGWMGSLSPAIDIGMVVRKYEKDFHTFYGNGFSEGSRLINEQGTYWGLKIHPNTKHEVAAYFDRFVFPWLKYQTEAPSSGYEYLGRYTFKPTRTTTMYAQFRHENKQLTVQDEGSNLSTLKTGIKHNYLVNIDYGMGSLTMKTRIQGSDYLLNKEKTRGFVISQDLSHEWKNLRVSSRFALFDTDNFKNAQYMYEKDVLYAFSIPALNGTGIRSYVVAQYNATKKVSIWARIARTSYFNQETIGSGLAKIEGNKRTDYRLMTRIRL